VTDDQIAALRAHPHYPCRTAECLSRCNRYGVYCEDMLREHLLWALAERDALRGLLREARDYVTGFGYSMVRDDLGKRIGAVLAGEKA
jgi:hypothetical protein